MTAIVLWIGAQPPIAVQIVGALVGVGGLYLAWLELRDVLY